MRNRLLLALLFLALTPAQALGFCGFFASSSGAEMFSNATQAVMMRSGNQTALTMQNAYEGPLEDFALVIPVPQVLDQANVKTLPKDIFDNIDSTSAPRLVEYFESDPCQHHRAHLEYAMAKDASVAFREEGGVKVEAQFKVGEYDIVVLSSNESTALETWLTENKYNIPKGAAPYLQPYIQGGDYFLVAKVDPEKVEFRDGRAVLSPLRFHYTSDALKLPIRLGMINSSGDQDLIVYILGDSRYQAANRENVLIPTNIEVAKSVKDNFGGFYKSLFDETNAKNPGAMITEYSWPIIMSGGIGKCDPCPPPSELAAVKELTALGGDVLRPDDPGGTKKPWTLTRLHTRYGKDKAGEDLLFEEAELLHGGIPDGSGEAARGQGYNRFQGRYIIRHYWKDGANCTDPIWNNWGGGMNRFAQSPNTAGSAAEPTSEEQMIALADAVLQEIPELGTKPTKERNEPERSIDWLGMFGWGWFALICLGGVFVWVVVQRIKRSRSGDA